MGNKRDTANEKWNKEQLSEKRNKKAKELFGSEKIGKSGKSSREDETSTQDLQDGYIPARFRTGSQEEKESKDDK